MARKPSYDELEARVIALENEVQTLQKAEAVFRESEGIYRSTFEQAAVGIAQVAMDGRFHRVNQRFCDIVGYSKEDLSTKGFQDITHPDDLRESVRRVNQLIKSRGAVDSFQKRYVRKGGAVVWANTQISLLQDSKGNPLYILAVIEDITARKEAEKALVNSEARYRTLFETSADAIFLYDAEGDALRFIDCNSSALSIFQMQREDLIGKHPSDVSPSMQPDGLPSKQKADSKIRAALEGHQQFFEWRHRRADGSLFDAEVMLTRIEIEGRKYVQCIVRDISDRKQTQEQLISRLKYEKALALCSKILLSAGDEEESLNTALTELLNVAEAGRVYLYENIDDARLGLCYSALVEVVKSGVAPVIHTETGRLLPYKNRIDHFYKEFSEGRYICGLVSDLPRPESDILSEQDIQSILVLPIWLHGHWYGLIGFDDTESPREWSDDEIMLLRTAAEIIGAFLEHRRSKKDLFRSNERLKKEIADREKAEEALKVQKNYLEQLIDFAPEALVVMNTDDRVERINSEFTRLFGYTAEEAIGRPINDLIAPDDMKEEAERYSTLVGNGDLLNTETIRCNKKGERIHVSALGSHFRDETGPKGIYGIYRDISERKKSEENLRWESSVNAALAGLSRTMISSSDISAIAGVVLDHAKQITESPLGYVTYIHPQDGEKIGCVQTAEPEGHRRIDISIPSDKTVPEEGDRGPFFRVLDLNSEKPFFTNSPSELQEAFHLKNKEEYPDRILCTPVVLKDKLMGRIALADSPRAYDRRDLEAVQRLSDMYALALQRHWREVEQEKLAAQLRQANKMEAVGTLAGGLAHDFNNLLMGIQGNTSLMLLDLDPDHPYYEQLKYIEQYVQSGSNLTRQLLGFARGGKYEVRTSDLNELVAKSLKMFARAKKEINIYPEYEEKLLPVDVDPGQIEQVFINIYVNAWQAMPSGGAVYVRTENEVLTEQHTVPFELKPGRYVKVSITDTGPGMNELVRQRIFDPFFTTKEMGRGTGLGLASAYGIVKNHGGIINVYSEGGKGSTFTVYLPASEGEIIKEVRMEEKLVPGTETILLVDDEEMITNVGKMLLEKLGYAVFIARNGGEALRIYREKQKEIELVVLDMIMPNMNGGETFERLKEIDPGVKVLLSSGYSLDGQAKDILAKGCKGFIQKPFDIVKFSRKIREAIEQ